MNVSQLPNDISEDNDLLKYFSERAKNSWYPILFIEIDGKHYPVRVDQYYDQSNSDEISAYIYGLNKKVSSIKKDDLSSMPKGEIFDTYLANLQALPLFENGKISNDERLSCIIEPVLSEDHEQFKHEYGIVCPKSLTYFTYNTETKNYCTTACGEYVFSKSLTMAAILSFEWAMIECGLCDN